MHSLIGTLTPWAFLLASAITLGAGFVKGAIGFAMPLIMIATLPSLMTAPEALAALILPTLVTNLHQSLRHGVAPFAASLSKFWRIVAATLVGIVISAPFVVILPQQAMFLLLGLAVGFFALLNLSGWTPEIPRRWQHPAEFGFGLVGGLYGGVSGTWGPPAIVYLLAIKVDKREMVRVLSVIFTMGAVMLTVAHLFSGVLNAATIPMSAALCIPAGMGMWLGYRVHDRLDAARFRRWTLFFLLLTALNLLRRGLAG
ncbi:MAG: sulfite exporter TauE/SafE family protein [Paracoccaceae bacterium]